MTTTRNMNSFIICLIAMAFIINAFVQPVEAISPSDFSGDTAILYQKGNDYYFMDYQPPIRYGKAFGYASDYTSAKKTKVMLKKTWKNKKQKYPMMNWAMEKIAQEIVPELGVVFNIATVAGWIKEDVRGVKLVRTTYYNKNTCKYKVGKNRKCRKEVWTMYLKVKNKKTGKFSWVKYYTAVGFRAVITIK